MSISRSILNQTLEDYRKQISVNGAFPNPTNVSMFFPPLTLQSSKSTASSTAPSL